MNDRTTEHPAHTAFPGPDHLPRPTAPSFSHLSLELGHFYRDDLAAGPERLREQFDRIAPWVDAARQVSAAQTGAVARISTCFLVDDRSVRRVLPKELLPELLGVAADAGLAVDYLARESAFAEAGAVHPARLVESRLAPAPPPGRNGCRPPTAESGWLSNGERSPIAGPVESTCAGPVRRPLRATDRHSHSVHLDVELWREGSSGRRWSCSFLAAVWQLLRLGLLRDRGRAALKPVPAAGEFPESWSDLPALIQLRPGAAPFTAYRTCSVLPSAFLPVEHAVRVILDRWAPEPTVLEQMAEQAALEDLALPEEIARRVDYVFYGPS
ncbi:SCO2522 family protein [Kitasatospora sp. CM 4170]|uniref:SCO2522 family protein n=1 Tax=Kitasatospora aburaviensis TaxID=67265 RepID=A0ABW1F4C3_9ACTN|nr:SCO2522 family protein [Kitasatospora sp. CM 4170]WNM49062.1 SCO2522 family protein [Kitasatospora sp. CM 4170]